MTSLNLSIFERKMLAIGKQLKLHAEIDSGDASRDLVLRGKWTTIMPVSVFKEMQAPERVVLSEISGVQLNRLLVLATRSEPETQPAQTVVHDLLEAEFSRLVRLGMFSFGAGEVVKIGRANV